MGHSTFYCIICGASLTSYVILCEEDDEVMQDKYPEERKKMDQQVKWFGNNIGIDINDNVYSLGSDDEQLGEFDIKNPHPTTEKFDILPNVKYEKKINKGSFYGIVCHKTCYELLQNNLGYELKYSNVKNQYGGYNKLKNINYTLIDQYCGQDFDYRKIVEDDNVWLIDEPTKDNQNGKRILKDWNEITV
ncbi:MAG: hypothetical protein Edafosvirus1_107 [Edafosvirus sp.]|uniref:Uncharacterized protein n=1 Tax=Edafosvirus sp. TaxID=2487765 RepID=A0A3G4ZSA8_9VIRU|nr:MAG: hypothetical protein Edafosvirus1_107 [Edafosvirus sp.]